MADITDQEHPKKVGEPIIVVDNVSMIFNIASEQLSSLKEYFIKILKRELFFEEFVALKDISFTINRGEVYGLVGTNGSGKSTMLKIIAGVLEPSKGHVEIGGTIAPLIELGAGFDMELTARENIYLNSALLGYSKKFVDERFDEIVDFADVREFLDMPIKNYSSGMVARVAFSIATATIPDILVVDEALSVGDFLFQEKCEQRIDDLVKNHGTTLLFVSHSIDQVERVCERAIWIEKGEMRMVGDVDEVCRAYRGLSGDEGEKSQGEGPHEGPRDEVSQGKEPQKESQDVAPHDERPHEESQGKEPHENPQDAAPHGEGPHEASQDEVSHDKEPQENPQDEAPNNPPLR